MSMSKEHLLSNTCTLKWDFTNILIIKQGQRAGFRARAGTAEINCICLAVTVGSLRQAFSKELADSKA